MSRRKQSNPKPHKPGDEDTCWSNEDDEKMSENLEHGKKESSSSPRGMRKSITPPLAKQEESTTQPSRLGSPVIVGLRINTLLATDPAIKKEEHPTIVKSEPQQQQQQLPITIEESFSSTVEPISTSASVIKRVANVAIATTDIIQTGERHHSTDNDNNRKQRLSPESSSTSSATDSIAFVTIKNEPSSSPPIGPSIMNEQDFTQSLASQPLSAAATTTTAVLNNSKNFNGGTVVGGSPVIQSSTLLSSNSSVTELSRVRIDASTDTNNKLGYVCPPCGIKFSSPSTLEAHQTYYCSHRPRKVSKGGTESEDECGRVYGSNGAGYDQDDSSSGADIPDNSGNKVCKTGKQYRCTHCSYSADKKVSLNRHMRMHSVSPATSVTNDSDSAGQHHQQATTTQSIDRYCQECDIRFSNLKTFRAHKMHYCSTRNVIKTNATTVNSLSPTLPLDHHPPVNSPPIPNILPNCVSPPPPFLALPTNPILIVPYSLIQAASIVSTSMVPNVASQNAAYFLLPDGTLQLVTQTMQPVLSHNVPSNIATTVLQPTQPNQMQVKNAIADRRNQQLFSNLIPLAAAPLDLSLKRNATNKENLSNCSSSDTYEEEDKENHHHHRDLLGVQYDGNTTDHEDIVCAPSIPLLLSTASSNSTPSPTPSLSPRDSVADDSVIKSNALYGSPPLIGTGVPPKSAKRLVNGVIKGNKSDPQSDNVGSDKTIAAADLSINGVKPSVLNGSASSTDPRFLADVLLAAAATVFESAQKSAANNNASTSTKIPTSVTDRTFKDLPFPPEILPHLTSTLAQLSSAALNTKRATSVSPNLPTASNTNTPLAFAQDLRNNPAILPFLSSEMVRLASSPSATNFTCTVPPVPFVRQGTWKCEDCNIGFCKYENYLAHKKHYCSTRKVQHESAGHHSDSVSQNPKSSGQRTSPVGSPLTKPSSPSQPSVVVLNKDVSSSPVNSTVGNNSNGSNNNANVTSAATNNASSSGVININGKQPPPTFVHVVCNLCGIKFSSLDNLTTHQTYYCPNRGLIQETDKSSLKCTKCKILLPVDQLPIHQCGNPVLPVSSGWKCPCCLVIFATADAVQKHIQSHSGIKAFLCTICNYKGNTIRGMRTHIRVHFNKRNTEVMEENYITCILEETGGSAVTTVDETAVSDRKSRKSSCSSEEVVCNGDSPSKKCSDVHTEAEDDDEYIDVDEVSPSVSSNIDGKREIKLSSPNNEDDNGIGSKSPKDRTDNNNSSSSDESSTGSSSNNNNSKKSSSNYCDSCDISFNYLSTFIAHKKYYCSAKRGIMRNISSSPPLDGIAITVNGTSEAAIQIT